MKAYKAYVFHILLTILLLTALPQNVFATSWVKLEPAEIAEKAEIIVKGIYRIPEDQSQWRSKGMWVPFDFTVEQYYKGAGDKVIRVAIEQNDINWVKDLQDRGGRFYLFLSESEDKQDYWIPVGGPNGMIQIEKGKIKNLTSEEVTYYNNLLAELNSKEEKPEAENPPVESEKQKLNLTSIFLMTAGAFIIIYFVIRRASS